MALRAMKRWSRSVSTLAFEEVESQGNGKTAMLLHGLLGSGRNWRGFAKRLSETIHPDWKLVLVDLRNHGRSAEMDFAPPHDIPSAAKDVAELVKAHPQLKPDVLIGHSMGGKVVLEYAKSSMERRYGSDITPPRQLWVLDSVVGKVPIKDEQDQEGEVERVLATIQTLPDPMPSRKWLVNHMVERGFSKALSNWLGSNVKLVSSTSEECTWVFNIRGAYDMFTSYRNSDYWSLLEHPPEGSDIGLVRALKSDRWSPEVISRLEDLAGHGKGFTYRVLEDAGHWLHVDNPEGLVKLLAPSFEK